MSTTEITTSPRRNRVAATVTVDGERFGAVVMRGAKFTATRKHGTDTDIRRFAEGFHTAEAAARWIEMAA